MITIAPDIQGFSAELRHEFWLAAYQVRWVRLGQKFDQDFARAFLDLVNAVRR